MKARYLQVLVEVPADVSVADAIEYIVTELTCAGGCRRLEDPLHGGLGVVKIRSVRL
jgi:hypothetical protein